MSENWKSFASRLANGETVNEIIDLGKKEETKSSVKKYFSVDVEVDKKIFNLKPMVPTLHDITFQDNFNTLILPHPSIPISQLLPL